MQRMALMQREARPPSATRAAVAVAWLLAVAPPPAVAALALHAGGVVGPDGVERVALVGAHARQQIVAIEIAADGGMADATRRVRFTVEPAGVAAVDDRGVVAPLRDGTAVVSAEVDAGAAAATARLTVEVRSFDASPPAHFAHEVVPLLTKHGCNGGGCHGAAAGQNGFRLSLLGFEPDEDYRHLVQESRGRRLSVLLPDTSLLLEKAAGLVPHGGGARIEPGSLDWLLLRRWIAEGALPGDPAAAAVERLEVFPPERLLVPDEDQQLVVTAVHADGTRRDVTAAAVYEPNVPGMARVTRQGLVTAGKETGDVAVMVRYQSHVAVFRATIPLGRPVTALPPERNFIDRHVFGKLRLLGLPPSGLADDATFLRRVTIDVAGRLPTAAEARAFAADADPDKRDRWLDRLLAGPDYAAAFATKWSVVLRNKRDADNAELSKPGTYAFYEWLRQALEENRPYDRIVRGILTASGEMSENPPVAWFRAVKANETRVEDVAQLFLGQRIQCAKCHHHPFDRWSQADYYRLLAFFAQVGEKPGYSSAESRLFHKGSAAVVEHPKSKAKLTPAGLAAAAPEIAPADDPRPVLVDWMADPDNPFFARALVNRYWRHFFGRGIVDPEDDMRATNPPANPALLDALADHFVTHGYDLEDLVRTICRSNAYRLDSRPNDDNLDDRQNFSRFYPRRLQAEVLADAVDTVAGSVTRYSGVPAGVRAMELPDADFSSPFLEVFGRPKGESACECERGSDANLSQGLHLLNSKELSDKFAAGGGRAARLAGEKDRDRAAKIEDLYFTAFARGPTAEEAEFVGGYLAGKNDAKEAWEDVLWSLVNSKEFLFNH
jgi:hypothetical protein